MENIKPRIDKDGVGEDTQYHSDGTCCLECPHLGDTAFRMPYNGVHVAVRSCQLFGLPMAQSIHICPVYTAKMTALLRESAYGGDRPFKEWIHDVRALIGEEE